MARKKRKGVHPLVSAATLAPLAIALLTPKTRPTEPAVSRAAMVSTCTLPFASIQQHHPIDDSCGPEGVATKTPQIQQNQAKNNFCATGVPVDIDFDVLHELQRDAEDQNISFGSDGQIPDDRSVLRSLPTRAGRLGEGTVVRLAAFVVDAHYSNVSNGESVNCKMSGTENNDIHIVLGEKSNAKGDECASVTAEMSPHFRPELWTPKTLNDGNAHMYRFTGQLFFDASHRPCANGKGSPKRSSIWEVHPVYAVDVCKAASCDVANDTNWEPLAAGEEEEDPSETRLVLPDDISREFGRR